jgi:hypothetical protein
MKKMNNEADQVKENKVERECGKHGRGKCARLWWERPKEENHSGDQRVDARMG